MPQLLESTRNYLKSSTKIGRRLSSYRDDLSGSETSLHAPSSVEIKQKQHKHSPQHRLSSLFAFEGRIRNSISSEDRVTISVTPAKESEPQEDQLQNDKKKKRRNSSSSKKSTASASSSDLAHSVPRGPSPCISISPTVRTVSSSVTSYYDSRPSDYPNAGEYNSHVWRRTLLEESIMHSLNLGYGQPSPQRSLKRSATGRSREAKAPKSTLTVIDRNISTASRILSPQQEKPINKNSPYQQLHNPSSSNITHSFASFTLELPEHQVTHVMSASAVPNLFTLKMSQADTSKILDSGLASEEEESKENVDPMIQTAAAV
ncbi:hypothetical protein BGZ76_005091 [Entomortierella beljakovae]|nr:hypothetical protein BGZ76_005091 [Entomortierella beljakovae]